MKKATILFIVAVFGLTLAGCGQSEEARRNLEQADGQERADGQSEKADARKGDTREGDGGGEEVVVGGFEVEGPEGREISVPETTVEREALEEYLDEVRPVVEDTAQDLSRVVEPEARLEDRRLTLSVEVESIEQARRAAQEGLQELRRIEPPEDLEPVHDQLMSAYEDALPAYENIIEAFNGEDVGELTGAVQENLPEIEQVAAETRAILQELQRAERQEAR